jgi:type IV secretory pathway VirB2 component (pilin)
MVAGAAPAAAQDLNHVAQAILNELNSTFLQLVAVIAIIGIAMGWMFHVIRPLTALVVGAGIAVAASATTIASSLFAQ